MKNFKILSIFAVVCLCFCSFCLSCANSNASFVQAQNTKNQFAEPMMAIIIDDFGGYERDGVEAMLQIDAPLTCAVIPFVDNTKQDSERASESGHEVILHMPMESHVRLPESWYGPIYIKNSDGKAEVTQKLDECIKEVPMAKGVNIHIGSGVSQNKELMENIITHLKSKNMYFCDSRTHLRTQGEQAAHASGQAYLGRDVFLEPHGEKSYNSAVKYLLEGAKIALEKGYSVAIGHVGREGGEQTAKAIADTLPKIKEMGVKIVPLSKINDILQGTKV